MPKTLISVIFLFLFMNNDKIIFDFSNEQSIRSWKVIDDVVMGGRSLGNFIMNEQGNAVFYGNVSTENNGGFSSVRYQFSEIQLESSSKIKIRLKGDGNTYQFRIKKNKFDDHSYVLNFKTTTNWETIEINIFEMQPKFRGRSLHMSNFSSSSFQEIAFLIGNKKNQDFKLEIDKIYLD